MIRIEGITEEEWSEIKAFQELEPTTKYFSLSSVDVGRVSSKKNYELTECGVLWMFGYRAAPRISPEAQAMLDIMARPGPIHFERFCDGWVPFDELSNALADYRRSLAPVVDIEALEREKAEYETEILKCVREGRSFSSPIQYNLLCDAIEKAQAPKPKTELDLAREALTRLRTCIGPNKMDYINSEWRVVVEALEEWEKAR